MTDAEQEKIESASRLQQKGDLSRLEATFSGSRTVTVRDMGIAVALISCGVPCVSPGAVFDYDEGGRRAIWNFAESNPQGTVNAAKLAPLAAKDPYAFCAEFGTSPFAIALMAILNYPVVYRQVRDAVPFVQLSTGDGILTVKKDGRKHQAALRRNFVEVPCPFPPAKAEINLD